jgi:outer membrane translocation and assembly module TamA
MDMALFVDAGTVASRRAALDLDHLRSNVGLGVRFHGPSSTPLRIEVARGREGWHLVFAGSPAF